MGDRTDEDLAKEDWGVWIEWYNAVLPGQPNPWSRAAVDVLLDNDLWKRGNAKEINGEIRALMDKSADIELADTSNTQSSDAENFDFFLSYAGDDTAYAHFIDAVLRGAGYSVFVRFRDMPIDSNFVNETQYGLRNTKRFLAVFSPAYFASPNCRAEWAAAYAENLDGSKRKILPLLIKDTNLEPFAKQIAYKNLIGLSGEQAEAVILQAIGHASQVETEEPIDTPAQTPALETSAPVIPAPRPAAIEPIISNDKLILPKIASPSDLKPPTLTAALKALREQIEKLADDYEKSGPNPDRRMIAYLRELAARVPKSRPKQQDLFAFGHEKKVLEGYASKANEEWPEILAARYHGMTLAFDRTLKQFPKWREFLRNASGEIFTPAQINDIHEAATQTSGILRHEDALPNVDPDLPEAIDALNEKLNEKPTTSEILADLDAAKQELAADLIESLNNIWKRIAESALGDLAKDYAKEFKAGAKPEFKKLAKKDGVNFAKWAHRIFWSGVATGGIATVHFLSGAFPEYFGWLPSVIMFLTSMGAATVKEKITKSGKVNAE